MNNNPTLEMSKEMDKDTERRITAENEKLSVGVQERIRASGLNITGPAAGDYDYVGADRDAAPLAPAEGGGVNLPNKFHQNQYLAGRRVSDGMKVHDRKDPNGFGQAGFERAQAGYVNTETGAPPESMDAVIPLMAEHVQNGGTLENFQSPYGPDRAADAYQTLQATAAIQGIVHELRALPPEELSESEMEEPADLQLEDMIGDPQFIESARVIQEYFGAGDEENPSSNAQLAEDMVEEMAATFGSAWKMGSLIYGIESGDISPEVQDAYLYALQQYDKFTPWSMDVLQGSLTGIVQDTPGYLGSGGVGLLAGKAAAKTAMAKALMQRLMANKARQVATVTAATSGVTAVDSGAFAAGEEVTRQKITGIENFDRVWQQGTNGAIAGAILSVPFGVLAQKPGREFVSKAYSVIADEIGRSPSPMKAQGGWIGVKEAKTYNGIPTGIDDLGLPMADSQGTSYFSNLYRTAIDGGLIGNKETDPAKYLQVLQAQQKKGKFKGYEMQEARLGEFLQGKIDAGETINKDIVDDYLWANRPRVNSALSSVDNVNTDAGNEMMSTRKSPATLRRDEVKTAIKDNFYEVDEVMNAQGQRAWKVTNKLTQQTEITQSPGTYLSDSVRSMVKGLSDDEVVALVRLHDKEALLAPPRWGKDVMGKGSPTIIKGDNANNYQELRLFLPYGGMDNVDDIAMERFNKPFSELTEREAKRVERIKGFATERRPEDSFRDEFHYPLEHNRMVQIRTQELYQPQHGGERVLAVNEMQSDLRKALKQSDKDTEGGQFIVEDSAGNEIKQPSKQAIAGWMEMSMNRTFQLAEQQGYNKIAFPVDEAMIDSIQLWTKKEERSKGVYDAYANMAKMASKDKKLKKTWGITSVKEETVSAAPDGTPLGQKMLVITFDAPKGEKPIYGVGVTAGAGGAMSIDAKDEEE